MKEDQPQLQIRPIPELARYTCPSCLGSTIAEAGQKLLCQECVNQFLAKNVGTMEQEIPEPPTPPHTTAVEGEGTG